MTVLDLLNLISPHLSTVFLINGILFMLSNLLDRTLGPEFRYTEGAKIGQIKAIIDWPVSLAQIASGLLTTYTLAWYAGDVINNARPLNLPAAILLFIGGTGNIFMPTRNWPWTLLFGFLGGALGAAGVLSLSAGVEPVWIGAAAFVGFFVFLGVWYWTRPLQDLVSTYGKGMSWGPLAVPLGAIQCIFAILAIPPLGLMLL